MSMALDGGRRSGANPPTQGREGDPQIEIQMGAVRGRGRKSHEEEERGQKKRAPPPLYSPSAEVLAVVPLPIAVVPLGSWR